MSRKIFVSYKHSDRDVRPLPSGGIFGTTARSYVNELENLIDANDDIYKGENDDESLEGFKDEFIESKLRKKIFDSSVTLVLISKNMKNPHVDENDQWIPWEVSYSLKEMTKGERTSRTNAMVGVVLPDRNGSYEYLVKNLCSNGCRNWNNESLFQVIGKNMFNRKKPIWGSCGYHSSDLQLHTGNSHSYIYPVLWDAFESDMNFHITIAEAINENVSDYEIKKMIRPL